MPSLRRTADRRVRFAPASPGGARLLDIGCATGTCIEMMRDLGWETRGVEMDAGLSRPSAAAASTSAKGRCRT